MAERVERLTNLLALLLETPQPLESRRDRRRAQGQYPESQTACRAAFERDKAALREIGVPIEQEIVGGGEYAGQTRYWIDRERYELRDLDLAEDESRALQVAMAATRPGSTSGQEALWKLGAGVLDRSAPVAAVLPDPPEPPVLRDAAACRTSVRFDYRDVARTRRSVGPPAARWLLVRDRLRPRARRAAHVPHRPHRGRRRVDPGQHVRTPGRVRPASAFPEDPR